MSITRHLLWFAAMAALTVGCKQTEFGGDAPVAASQNAAKTTKAPDDTQQTDQRSNEDGDDLGSNDDGDDGDLGIDLSDRCEEKNGTYVKGEGCYVCEDDRQEYDAIEKQCLPDLGTNEDTGKKIGTAINIFDTILKNIPKGNPDDDDDDIGGPGGGGADCGC